MDFFKEGSQKTIMAAVSLLFIGFLMSGLEAVTGAQSLGVCNGRLGNDLPSEQEVVDFYRSNGIGKMRIYDPNQATLQALRGSNIELTLGVPNQNLQALADASAANNWVQGNIITYAPDVKFRYISVGNEVKPNDAAAQFVLPAMRNIYNAIASATANLTIKVSTSIEQSLLSTSYPPSAGAFSTAAGPHIKPIVQFLASTGAPLLVNVYTYFSYIDNPQKINLAYALLNSVGSVVKDGNLNYNNLFDASVDALYSALEGAGGSAVEIVVTETGWPSAGHDAATFSNAEDYYQNVINHIANGTPKRPGRPIETYLFAMFDENQKGGAETERHFGLFFPNKQPKYQVQFS